MGRDPGVDIHRLSDVHYSAIPDQEVDAAPGAGDGDTRGDDFSFAKKVGDHLYTVIIAQDISNPLI
jgi:hypothetical protein